MLLFSFRICTRQACSSQHLSTSTKMTTNAEKAMLSNLYSCVSLILGCPLEYDILANLWRKAASEQMQFH